MAVFAVGDVELERPVRVTAALVECSYQYDDPSLP